MTSVSSADGNWGAFIPESPFRTDIESDSINSVIEMLNKQEKSPSNVNTLFTAILKIPSTIEAPLLEKIFRRTFVLCKRIEVPNPNAVMVSQLERYYHQKLQHLVDAILANKPYLEESGKRDQNLLAVVLANGTVAEIESVIRRYIKEIPEMTYQQFCDTYLSLNLRNLVEREDAVEMVMKIFALLKAHNADLSNAVSTSMAAMFCRSAEILRLLLNEIAPENRNSYLRDDDNAYKICKFIFNRTTNLDVKVVEDLIALFEENGLKIKELLMQADEERMTLIDHAAFECPIGVLRLLLESADPESLQLILENHVELIGGVLQPQCYFFADAKERFELIQNALL